MPGLGALEFERVAEVFGWCFECGQFVGRACCWGPGWGCARCADAREASGDDDAASAFAALATARAAVRQMDGAAAEFSAVENAITAIGGAGAGAAVGTWEDAWLAAGTLKTRIDSTHNAAISRLGRLPVAEAERVLELDAEFRAVTLSHEAQWRSVVEGISEAGRRLAPPVAHDPPQLRAAPGQAPRPVAAVAVAVVLAIRPPDRVNIPVAAESRTSLPSAMGPATATMEMPTTTPAATPPTARPRGARRPPHPPRPAVGTASPRERPVPVPPPTAPVPAASLRSRAQPSPEPAVAGTGNRRRRRTVAALSVVGAVVVAGGILANSVGALRRDAGTGRDRDPGSRAVLAPTSSPALATGPAISSPLLVSFDLHPVGPLDPEELPITRIIGAPEVAAFPTAFDRSLRLTGGAAGVCLGLASASQGRPASLAFDLHLAEAGAGGRLVVALPATDSAPPIGLALDLATFKEVDRDAWYRLAVTGEGEGGRVAVTTLEDERPVLAAELGVDATIVPASTEEACLLSSLPSSDAAVYLDNLRVDR